MSSTENLLSAAERIRKALLANDPVALAELVADDFQGVGPRGETTDRLQMLEAYSPGGVDLDRYETRDVSTRISGDLGLVMGVGELDGSFGEHSFEHRLRFIDVYEHSDSGWQLLASQVTEIEADP